MRHASSQNRITALLNQRRSANRSQWNAEPKAVPNRRPYYSLSDPLVALYVSPSNKEKSREAFAILAESRTGFRVVCAGDDSISAEFAGKMQYGIAGVEKLKRALLRFERTMIEKGPGSDPSIARLRRKGVKEQAEQELAGQFDAARKELDRILA